MELNMNTLVTQTTSPQDQPGLPSCLPTPFVTELERQQALNLIARLASDVLAILCNDTSLPVTLRLRVAVGITEHMLSLLKSLILG
jgi:hypothetical protein